MPDCELLKRNKYLLKNRRSHLTTVTGEFTYEFYGHDKQVCVFVSGTLFSNTFAHSIAINLYTYSCIRCVNITGKFTPTVEFFENLQSIYTKNNRIDCRAVVIHVGLDGCVGLWVFSSWFPRYGLAVDDRNASECD